MAEEESLHDAFVASTREALTELDNALVRLEGGRDDAGLLPQLRRILHTIKGSCSMFGLGRAAETAHALEDLSVAGTERGGLPPEVVALCFEGADLLRGLIERFAVDGDEGDDAADLLGNYVDRVRVAAGALAAPSPGGGGGPDAAAAEAVLREIAAIREELDGFADFDDLDEAAERLRTSLQNAAPATASPPGAAAPEDEAAAAPAEPEAHGGLSAAEAGGAPAGFAFPNGEADPAAGERTVRVSERRVDDFLHGVGELIEVSEVCKHLHRRMGGAGLDDAMLREFRQITQKLDERVIGLHRALMDLRRVPVRPILDRLPRLARDLCRELGREAELVCAGEDAAVDKSLLDQVEACAVQLVRNAVAHGVEPPGERRAAGKPARARIEVTAHNEDRFLLLTVRDDGRGLDHDRLRERAVALGALGEREAESLSDEEAGRLIFTSGLSTSRGVDMASGRGVGLDVVAEEVNRLGGGVGVESRPGAGAAVTLRLPLDVTLTVRSGLVARTGALRFVAPSEAVLESIHPAPGMVTRVQGRGEMLLVHGKLAPLHRSARIFGLPQAVERAEDGVAVVLEADGRRAAYLFDEVLEMQQVVVKTITGIPLARGIAGGAVLGDGRVGLVLDPEALLAAGAD